MFKRVWSIIILILMSILVSCGINNNSNSRKIENILKSDIYKEEKEKIYDFLGKDLDEVIERYGEPDEKSDGWGLFNSIFYEELGVLFVQNAGSEGVTFIIPVKEERSITGIQRGDSFTKVKEILGDNKFILFYERDDVIEPREDVQLGYEYKIGDYLHTVIFDNGRVELYMISKEDMKLNFDEEEYKSSIDEEKLLMMIGNTYDNVERIFGDAKYFLGELPITKVFDNLYYSEGVIFKATKRKRLFHGGGDVESIIFFNREIFGISTGMKIKDIDNILGVTGEDGEVIETNGGNMFSKVYSVKGYVIKVYTVEKDSVAYLIEIMKR